MLPVLSVVRARIVRSHNDEDMLELRADVGDERKGTRLLQIENHEHKGLVSSDGLT